MTADKLMLGAVCAGLAALICVPQSYGIPTTTYGFNGIASPSTVNTTTGEKQLFVDVEDIGGGQVRFTFRNTGSTASSITDVYFDDGTLLSIASVNNGTGVEFSQDASPGDLPGGNALDPDFEATAGFTADSGPPIQSNGVNPGEYVGIVFTLKNGKTYADTIAALAAALNNQSGDWLRIGIHVQAFANGGSESFVNGGALPDGGTTLVLLGISLTGLGLINFRKTKA